MSLLAILDQGACYGYQLRAEFERRTGAAWPLNVGQIYSTLDRLERDQLITKADIERQGQNYYAITEAGRQAVAEWLNSPVVRSTAARDELAIKLAIAVTLPGVDIAEVIQVQRKSTLMGLQDLTRTKSLSGEPESIDELAWLLVADGLIFAAEAEARWLDHSETRMRKAIAAGLIGPLSLDPVIPKRGRPAKTASEANR